MIVNVSDVDKTFSENHFIFPTGPKMYQVPVKDVGKIRRSRKKVKNILCDIALLDCQELIKVIRRTEIYLVYY